MLPEMIEKKDFIKFGGFKRKDRVLDIGAGDGRWAEALALKGCKVYMTETGNKVKKLKNKFSNFSASYFFKHEVYAPSPQVIDIKDDKNMDKVILSCVLHYNSDKVKLLNQARDALKKKGEIIIIEPNPYNLGFYLVYIWRWIKRSKCPRRWNKERFMCSEGELYLTLWNSGFRKIQSKKYAWFPTRWGWINLNEKLNQMTILKIFNAFNWVKGVK